MRPALRQTLHVVRRLGRLGRAGRGLGRRPRVTVVRGPLALVGGLVGLVFVAFAVLMAVGVSLLAGRRARARMAGVRTVWSGTSVPPAGAAPPPPAEPAPERPRSYAEVVEALPVVWLLAGSLTLGSVASPSIAHAKWLVPMDESQTDHLKAYGLTYWVLTRGQRCEWLLNYRGGSFLLPEDADIERQANVRGVTLERMDGGAEAAMRATVADENMEVVALEKAPNVAVYIPPNTPPWDDAVTLALKYAEIEYATVWDEEVL